MALTKSDKKVIDAFTEHLPASSKLLTSDGETLSGNYLGGSNMARWSGGKIRLRQSSSKTEQAVHRALAKIAPRSWLVSNPSSGAKQRARMPHGFVRYYDKEGPYQYEGQKHMILHGAMPTGRIGARAAMSAAEARRSYSARMKGGQEGIFEAELLGGLPALKKQHAYYMARSKAHRPSLPNPAAQSVDKHAATELVLYVENDHYLYTRRLPEYAKNLARKIKRGTYNAAQAVKLLEYLTKEAATKYDKEFGSGYSSIFSPATRRAAAAELLPTVVEQAQQMLAEGKVRNPRKRRNPREEIRIQGTYYLDPNRAGWSVAPFAKAYTFKDAKAKVEAFFANGHAAHATEANVEIWSPDHPHKVLSRTLHHGKWNKWHSR